jgi:hypothetical protein
MGRIIRAEDIGENEEVTLQKKLFDVFHKKRVAFENLQFVNSAVLTLLKIFGIIFLSYMLLNTTTGTENELATMIIIMLMAWGVLKIP